MHRTYPLVLLAAALVLAVAAVRYGPAERAAAAPAPNPAPPVHDLHFVGVGSCASAACHNGNGPPGSKGSEYTTWIARDPHARAYTALQNARSQTIQANLNRSRPSDQQVKKAEQNPVCLRCHSVAPEQVPPGQEFQLADGVGCESCHGPAERWKTLHYLADWKGRSREYRSLGFADTKNLTVRAQMCAQCHVGSPEKDVDHELIAAGHPRLRFEYAAYLANYPKHWNPADDLTRYPDLQGRAWVIGQVVSAGQSMKLLSSRAADAHKAWPEFAEYDCFACHHEITTKNWRQRPTAPRLPGTPEYSTWYTSMLPVLSEAGPRPAPQPRELEPLANLEQLMRVPLPDRRQVAKQADLADGMLSSWQRELEATPMTEQASLALMRRLAADDRKLAGTSWDSAVQLYLAVAAEYAGLADRDPRYRQDAALRSAIRDLGVTLEKTFPAPSTPEEHYDSPTDYRPQALDDALRTLQQQLGPR